MYQEIKPTKRLNQLIDSLWVFSNDETFEKFKILPDTCTDLIFDLNQNKGFLSGVMSKFQLKELAVKSDIIGIRITTEKFGSLSKIPLSETKNLQVELSDIFSGGTLNKLEQVKDLETLKDKIMFFENFILDTFEENYHRQDKMVICISEEIRKLKGNLNIKDLANANYISLRQLERRFKSYTGLTIKEFSNIVRFNYAREVITDYQETSLLEIAFDMGFFDHSHMNYEFNRISGDNPSYFR